VDPATLILLGIAGIVAVAVFARNAGASQTDRSLREEEQGWVDRSVFPAEVRRIYARHALELLDRPRMGFLGYTAVQRERAPAQRGRGTATEVTWKAERPPALPADRNGPR
jgi:hypothetical protein